MEKDLGSLWFSAGLASSLFPGLSSEGFCSGLRAERVPGGPTFHPLLFQFLGVLGPISPV